MYILDAENVEGCFGYVFTTPKSSTEQDIWGLVCNYFSSDDYLSGIHMGNYDFVGDGGFSIRPVICLPSGITGIVGTSVSIDK